jgi:tetratricopeptide (TPR) repeat protein
LWELLRPCALSLSSSPGCWRWLRRPPTRTFGATPRSRSNSASLSRKKVCAALNNLAIAYEHEGELAKARSAYEKALELEPDNALIKQNYELFREINDRATRKDSQ